MITREHVDVVVVDVSDPGSPDAIETVRAFARPVGLVLVADEAGDDVRQPVLARWGPFGDLMGAIEAAERSRAEEAESL